MRESERSQLVLVAVIGVSFLLHVGAWGGLSMLPPLEHMLDALENATVDIVAIEEPPEPEPTPEPEPETPPEPEGIDVFVVASEDRAKAFGLVGELRDAGLAADLDLAERSFKGQMKQADRSGARHAVILEPDGTAKLRDMTSGEQREVDPAALAAQLITNLAAR